MYTAGRKECDRCGADCELVKDEFDKYYMNYCTDCYTKRHKLVRKQLLALREFDIFLNKQEAKNNENNHD